MQETNGDEAWGFCDNCGLEMDDIPESWGLPCPVCNNGMVVPPPESSDE